MIAIMPSHQLGRPLVIMVTADENRSRNPPGRLAMYRPRATPRMVVRMTSEVNRRIVRGSASRMMPLTSLSPLEALMIVALPKSNSSVRTLRQKIREGRGSFRWYWLSLICRCTSMRA